jgi:hypothetical protein
MHAPRFQDRPDITPDVVHFTKGDSVAEAFAVLQKILAERQLLGGTGFIRGQVPCVCFTEAPLEQLCEIFWWTAHDGLRYKPFGILATKRWLFEQGGRPVVYQSDGEFELLPDELKHRHVRYEPSRDPPVDFTWEREWRVRTDSLSLDPKEVRVVVPSCEFAHELTSAHNREQDLLVRQYSMVLGDELAEMQREPFSWTIVDLDDLRPDWHFDHDRPTAR